MLLSPAKHSRKAPLTLAAVVVTAAAAFFASPAAAGSSCPNAGAHPILNPISLDEYEATVVCLTNEERSSRGLVPLRNNARLGQAAGSHSSAMVSKGFFDHYSRDGTSFSDRILATGYARGARKWKLTENLAWGGGLLGTPQVQMNGWMNSGIHRRNILDPRVREIGVGAAAGSPSNPNALGAVTLTADYGLAAKKKAGSARRARR